MYSFITRCCVFWGRIHLSWMSTWAGARDMNVHFTYATDGGHRCTLNAQRHHHEIHCHAIHPPPSPHQGSVCSSWKFLYDLHTQQTLSSVGMLWICVWLHTATTWSPLCTGQKQLHIPVIAKSLRHTCTVIMVCNQHLNMPHLSGGLSWILTWIQTERRLCA